jgi:ABC-type transport system involved in multi-copper enzyme maturation permease subunit
MDPGPILRFELRRTARQLRSYVIRVAMGLGLLGTAWLLNKSNYVQASLETPQALRSLAELLFFELTLAQGAAIVFLVPGLVAGSIAEEDRRGTMTDLLASPLSSRAIVLSKLVVQLVRTGVALGVGLAFVLPCALLRVLDLTVVAEVYVMLFAWTLFVASLSLLVSIVIPRPRLATVTAYVLIVGWLLGPIGYAPIAARLPRPLAWLQTLNNWVRLGHPSEVVWTIMVVADLPAAAPIHVDWLRWQFVQSFPRLVIFQLTASVIFVTLAVLLLRPLRLGRWQRGSRGVEGKTTKPRPPIGDDPTFWKEWHATGPLGRPALRWAFVVLCLILLYPLLGTVGNAFLEWRESWWNLSGSQWKRSKLNESLRHIQETLYLLGLISVAAIAATSVTGEREGGTWTSLASTLVTGREVARAKVIGALGALRRLAFPLLIIWDVGLMTGSVHPAGVVAAVAGFAIFLWYAAAIGVFCSMVSKTSEQAIGATLLVLFVGNVLPLLFVPLNLIGTLTGSWSAVYLAGSTPFMEWASLVSPIDIHEWLAGRRWDPSFSLPGGIWASRVELNAGLARTFVISLVFHTLGAIAATRAAARAFDAGRGRR